MNGDLEAIYKLARRVLLDALDRAGGFNKNILIIVFN